MRRFAGFLLLVVLLLGFRAPEEVRAWEVWCADDPVVSVNGNLLDIQVQMPVNHVLTMRQTTLTIVIPENTSGTVVVDDVSAFPMTTRIAKTAPAWSGSGPIPITIVVEVSASSDYPVRIVATPLANLTTPLAAPSTLYGTANTPLVMPMSLGR
jgi:hypothetical protein